jgi:hypothetical protein
LTIAAIAVPNPAADVFPEGMDLELRDLVARYLGATRVQQQAMLGAQMEADIDGRLPKLEKEGRMRVLRTISKLGDVTFKVLGVFSGDDTVRKELIARYLNEEQQKKAYAALDVTPLTYDFAIKAILTENGRTRYLFDVKPKKSGPGKFKGEVWVDGATGMPLRESGELVESPSFWLKRIRFAREYEMMDGVSVLKRFQSTAEVRLFGPAELDIQFSNFTRLPELAATGGGF